MPAATMLERIAIAVASLLLSLGLIAVLSGFFAGQDAAGISGANTGATIFPDQGHAHVLPGGLRPPYNSNPPTSGAHLPQSVKREEGRLNADQLLQALEVGDVVIAYAAAPPPPALTRLARSVDGTFRPGLAAAGQAVILTPWPGVRGYTALAWRRMLRVSDPSDARLRTFAQQWLGRGAG